MQLKELITDENIHMPSTPSKRARNHASMPRTQALKHANIPSMQSTQANKHIKHTI